MPYKDSFSKAIATADQKEHAQSVMRWCKKHGLSAAGLPYDAEFINADGISLQVLAPDGTSDQRLRAALQQGRRERDVVTASVLFCPAQWFDQAGFQIQPLEPDNEGPTP